MNQFDKTQIISFENTSESIKKALHTYQEILEKGEAFKMDVFNVEFKIKTETGLRRLQVSDTKNQELLKHAFRKNFDDELDNSIIEEDSEIYISEEIFFAIALEYPALMPTIVCTAQAILSCMRKLNNTDAVWVDDMRIFAVGSLYMLAKKEPQYSYLLAQFFIPNWDLEHATGYEYCLFELLKEHGWTEDLIKAFIWCDNAHFREHMSVSDEWPKPEETESLGLFLKANTQAYTDFKQAVINRFKQEPVLLFSPEESIEDQRPVLDIFRSLMPEFSAENQDDEEVDDELQLQATFIYDSLENEAMDLQRQIEEQMETPLVYHSESDSFEADRSKYLERDVYRGDGTKALKEFILALPKGSKLWAYIETGENTQMLNELHVEKIMPIAKQHAGDFYKCLFYHLDSTDNESLINARLTDILSDVMFDLSIQAYNENEEETDLGNGFVSHITINKTDSVETQVHKNEQFLRILDVFYKLLNVDTLSQEVFSDITAQDNLPLIDEEGFYKRYSKRGAPLVEEIDPSQLIEESKSRLSQILGSYRDEIDSSTFKQIDKSLALDRSMFDCSQWKDKNINTYCLSAYMLSKDLEQRLFDNYTQNLLAHFEEGPWLLAFNQLKRNINEDSISEEELKFIEDYFTAQQTTLADHESILALLKKHLYREECYRGPLVFNQFSKDQAGYAIFRYGDSYQRVVLLTYWLRTMMPPLSFQANRIWKLLIELAPQRVIRLISKTVSNTYFVAEFDSVQESDNFYSALERAKIPKEHIYAFQMVQSQNRGSISKPCDLNEYLSWLDLYDEIDSQESGMFGAARRNKALAFEKGMHYINETSRIRFYHDLSVRNPRFPFNQDADFQRALKGFLQLNSIDRELSVDDLLDNTLSYLDGHCSYTDINKLFKKQIRKHDLSTGYESSGMFYLGQFFWLLEINKQNRLMRLLINHSSEGFEVLEHGLCTAYQDQLIKEGEMTLEYRLENSLESCNEDMYWIIDNAYAMLLDRILDLDISMEHIVGFGLSKNTPAFNDYILQLARSGNIDAFIKKSQVRQREKLILLYSKQADVVELTKPLLNDKSRKIRDYAERFQK